VEKAREWTGYDPRFAQAERELRRAAAADKDERRVGTKHADPVVSNEDKASSRPRFALELVHRTASVDAQAHSAR
jgi:hypothetical protein